MARKNTNAVNKSKAIKDALANAPKAKSRDIVDALAAQGIMVTSTYVANVKSTIKRKGKGKKAQRGAKAAPANDSISLAMLVSANKLAAELGGLEKARNLLSALAKLSG